MKTAFNVNISAEELLEILREATNDDSVEHRVLTHGQISEVRFVRDMGPEGTLLVTGVLHQD